MVLLAGTALATVPLGTASAVGPPAGQFTVSVEPPRLATGSTTSVVFSVTDLGPAKLGSVRIALPTNFTLVSLDSAVSGTTSWVLSSAACTSKVPPCTGNGTYVEADPPPNGADTRLDPGSSLAISLHVKAPSTPGTATWSTAGTNGRAFSGSSMVLSGASPSTVVFASSPTTLALSGLPTGAVTAGRSFNVTVTATDGFGNTVTGYQGTVHFALSPPGSTAPATPTGTVLPADYTFTSGDAGRHTFAVTLSVAPSQAFYVYDTVTTSISGTRTMSVVPAAAASLGLSAAGPATAGSPFSATVTATDAYGNLATGYTGTVTFSTNDQGTGTALPATYTFVNGDAGSHAFQVTLTQAGSRTLGVTDGTLSGSTPVQVGAAAAQSLTLTGPSANVPAGQSFSVTVSALDQFQNVVPDFAGTVHFATAATGATVPSDYTFTAGDAGSHTFTGVAFTVAGSPQLTVTDTPDGLQPGTTTVNVDPGAATQITAAGPSTVTAGSSFGVTFTARDGYGNQATSYTGAASFTCTGTGSGSCPAGQTFVGGQLTVNATLTVAGAGSVQATSGALTPGTLAVTVGAGAASQLVVTAGSQVNVAAGQPFSITVAATDGFGNVVTGFPATSVTATSGPGVPPFPLTTTTSGGVASFTGVTVTSAGAYAIGFAAGNLSQTGSALNVVAAPAAQIVVTSVLDEQTNPHLDHPVVTKPFDTALQFLDGFGNPAPVGPGVTFTLSKTSGTGTLGGTLTVQGNGSSTATIAGSTYSAIENQVGLRVSASGATIPAKDFTVDVVGQSATAIATPGVALPTLNSVDPLTGQLCSLTTTNPTCSKLNLPRGGNGAIFLFQGSCVNDSDVGTVTCKTNGSTKAQLVHGEGNLDGTNGQPLYDRTHPAQLIVLCLKTLCTHPDGDAYGGYTNNLHELQEDVAANPLVVTVELPVQITADATICRTAGVIDSTKAFCIDPAKSGRDSKGNYIQVVNFFDDVLGHNR